MTETVQQRPLAAVILAAGLGTRMKSDLPKVLHCLGGQPMIAHLLAGLKPLQPTRTLVVVGPEGEAAIAPVVLPAETVTQRERLGTAHAVLAARSALSGFACEGGSQPDARGGDVLVLYGDTPFLATKTLQALVEARQASGAAAAVLGFRPSAPGAYGRLIVDPAQGTLEAIVEAKDATAEQLAVDLCNSGVMCLDGDVAFDLLARIGNDNAKEEYYLTDFIALARQEGRICVHIEAAPEELIGVNSRAELAAAEKILQTRLREQAMANGVTLIDPDTVWFSLDTVLGRDVVIGPQVVFGPDVTLGNRVEIRPFCHIEGAVVADNAVIGPFARLRPGASIGRGAHIGNFVEIKKAILEDGVKANHLSYIGDAHIGAGANIGAGTITCNYDGFHKHHTEIGSGAFIGSNSALVAPVSIGSGAIIGAGSVVTQDVADNSLAVARGRQTVQPGWAERFRESRNGEGKGKARR